MHRQANRAIDFFTVPYITSHRQRSLGITNSVSSGLHSARIARQHHHVRSMIGKNLRQRFPNPHRSARNHHDLSRKFHDVLLFSPAVPVNHEISGHSVTLHS